MSSSTRQPRPDFVAELTRGLSLPLPALDGLHMQIIAESIARVWTGLVADRSQDLSSGEEVEITACSRNLRRHGNQQLRQRSRLTQSFVAR